MKTNSQLFDIHRFADCFRRDCTLNGRSWLLKILLMLGVTTILLIVTTRIHELALPNSSGSSFLVFRFCATVFCALGASMFMENMTTPGARLNTLMSPASTLEKFLSRWLICIPGVMIAYFVCFAIGALIRVCYFNLYYDAGLNFISTLEMMRSTGPWYYFWGSIGTVQAVFVLGSTVAPKNAFLKTFGVGVVLVIAFSMTTGAVFNMFFHKGYMIYFENRETIFDTVAIISPLFWMTFCYITAYFRMKESEIINRP